MATLALVLFTISTSVWVGAIVFQSAVVAPAVFTALEPSAAQQFLRSIFPRFFRLGLVCGALMAVGLTLFAALETWSQKTVVLGILTGIMILLEAVSLGMVPSINAAKDQGAAGQKKFARLHLTNVALTVVILLLGLTVLSIVASGTVVS